MPRKKTSFCLIHLPSYFRKENFFSDGNKCKVDTILVERSKLAMDCPHKNVLIMKAGFKILERVYAKKEKAMLLPVTWKSQPFESRSSASGFGVLLEDSG